MSDTAVDPSDPGTTYIITDDGDCGGVIHS